MRARRRRLDGSELLRAHFGLVLVFLYAPIVVLVVLSFNESGLPTAWSSFSFTWYESVLHDASIIAALRNTLIVGAVSTLLACVLGTMLAFGLERVRRNRLLDGLVYVPMIVPDIVLAIALLSFYNLVFTGWLGLGLGLWSVIIAHTVFCTAFVAVIVRTRFRDFDHSTVEASLDLGASEARTFLRVVVPAIAPGIVAGALVAFTLSFDEFVIAFFTAGTAVMFPIKVYSMIRFGVTPEINAIATFVVVVSFTLVLLSQRLRGRELASQ